MKSYSFWGVAVCLMVGWSVPAGAADAPLPVLYHAEVPLAAKTPAVQKAAFATAMRQVVVRLTGDREAARSDRLLPLLRDLDRLVAKYEIPGVVQADREDHTLVVDFKPDALEAALRAAGYAIWHRERSPLLLWLAVSEKGERRLVGREEAALLKESMVAMERERGVVVTVPALDQEDRAHIEAADVWAGFREQILRASKRYGDQPVLSVALGAGTVGRWGARGLLLQNGEEERIVVEDAEATGALRVALDLAVDKLARGAPPAATEAVHRQFHIEVRGIPGADGLKAAAAYLRGLGVIQEMEPTGLSAVGTAGFDVVVRGGAMALSRRIIRSRVLVPVDEEGMMYRYAGPGAVTLEGKGVVAP